MLPPETNVWIKPCPVRFPGRTNISFGSNFGQAVYSFCLCTFSAVSSKKLGYKRVFGAICGYGDI